MSTPLLDLLLKFHSLAVPTDFNYIDLQYSDGLDNSRSYSPAGRKGEWERYGERLKCLQLKNTSVSGTSISIHWTPRQCVRFTREKYNINVFELKKKKSQLWQEGKAFWHPYRSYSCRGSSGRNASSAEVLTNLSINVSVHPSAYPVHVLPLPSLRRHGQGYTGDRKPFKTKSECELLNEFAPFITLLTGSQWCLPFPCPLWTFICTVRQRNETMNLVGSGLIKLCYISSTRH